MEDAFIKEYIDDVLKNIRAQVIIKLIKPYTRIDISFVSKQLNIPGDDVEALLVALILDGRIDGKIDQINQRLELATKKSNTKYYTALEKLATNITNLHKTTMNRLG
ncbi:hypothetical protein HDU96_000816 [Phlyctochytrium bullatum]|nr:hypothetical protein HDU96_000816 [Phlyctochytrium bullatum]